MYAFDGTMYAPDGSMYAFGGTDVRSLLTYPQNDPQTYPHPDSGPFAAATGIFVKKGGLIYATFGKNRGSIYAENVREAVMTERYTLVLAKTAD